MQYNAQKVSAKRDCGSLCVGM